MRGTMTVRRCRLKNAYGREYTYLQLVHNRRDKATGKTKTDVLMKLGREDQVEPSHIADIIAALQAVMGTKTPEGRVGFAFRESRGLGGTHLLDALWRRLGMGEAVAGLVAERKFRTPVERMCFALVAGRILSPGSKLSLEHWVAKEVLVEGLPSVDVHSLYRTMDLLVDSSEEIQKAVFGEVSKRAGLEVDLVFLDTTNTHFECDEDSTESGLLKRGHSKDGRAELPLVTVAFAVTRGGMPLRCWVFPGNTSDQTIAGQVKKDLGDWNLGRVVMVADAGFNSAKNRKLLLGSGGDYIIGEKLRAGRNGEPVEALRRPGRYRKLESGLEIKDVAIDPGKATERRFIVVRNPEAEARDRTVRAEIVAATEGRLKELRQLEGKAHTKAACRLRAHPVYGRYIAQDEEGGLSIDRQKVGSEALLDGKFLVSTSNMGMAAEDVVAGYKQLWEIERVFRDLKHRLDIRPVYHRLDDRIRSHVLLCWLAMVLVRYAERETGRTWHDIERVLSQVTVGLIEGERSRFWYRSDVPTEAIEILSKLNVEPPGTVIGNAGVVAGALRYN